MSQQQRVHKRQLTIMDNVESLSDQELREALKKFAQAPGPITDSTRSLYRRKLASLMEESEGSAGDSIAPQRAQTNTRQTPKQQDVSSVTRSTSNAAANSGGQVENKGGLRDNDDDNDDDDDSSDEDFNVNQYEEDSETDYNEWQPHTEEEEEEMEDDSDFSDSSDDINPLYEELKNKTINASYLETSASASTAVGARDAVAGANRISRFILFGVASFFVAIFSVYLYSANNQPLLNALKPYKNLTRQLLVLALLSPVGFGLYRLLAFYRRRQRQEAQKVCNLVRDAMELLQSPDNPTCLLPVLHIRDTLLTPAERRAAATMNLWKKAVKFVEEHESRVKVEMVNIDGEDFRAWKWIGLVKH